MRTIIFLLLTIPGFGQNLPALLLNKDINATFSITAYDPAAAEWGIAVATNNIYVGNSTIYIEPGVGAFSVIAETEPAYGINGLAQLKKMQLKEAIEYTSAHDEDAGLRQVAGIDKEGNTYAYVGKELKYWKGIAGAKSGKNYVVIGNQLAAGVLDSMGSVFERTKGTLAERLLAALVAGQQAGGMITGKQSAALMVKGTHNEWYNQIDVRVDHSLTPFEDLSRLLSFHYGRIRLNQAIFQLKKGNMGKGIALLEQATTMLEGWKGMQSKIAMANILAGREAQAAKILEGVNKEYIPAFYCLKNYIDIDTAQFDSKDWNSAVAMLIQLKRNEEAVRVAKDVVIKYPADSYSWYLLGKAYKDEGKMKEGNKCFERAVNLDKDNVEALAALNNN